MNSWTQVTGFMTDGQLERWEGKGEETQSYYPTHTTGGLVDAGNRAGIIKVETWKHRWPDS